MSAATMPRERRFFLWLTLICAVTIFAGFAPSYYLKNIIHAPPPLSPMTHVHGVVFTLWVLVFVLQVVLINRGNGALHRRIGVLAAMLFGAVMAVGFATALNAGRLGHAPPGSPAPLAFMALPLFAMTVTAVLVAAALWQRARRDAHMRYMLSALFAMTPPATHRLAIGAGDLDHGLAIAFVIMDALLAIAMLYDWRTAKRIHPAYLWSAAGYALVEIGVVWAYHSPLWLSFAQFLTQG